MVAAKPGLLIILAFVALLAWPSLVGAWYAYRRKRRKSRRRPDKPPHLDRGVLS